MRWLRKLQFLSFVVLALLGIASGCANKTMTIEFIVPNGFSGILKLKSNPKEATDLKTTNNVISLVFPESGTLSIKGKSPTLVWHRPTARFADGTPIPIPTPSANVPEEVVALRGLGLKNDNTEAWYLVGKTSQMQAAMKKFYGFEVPRQ
jgi:hypothetical protein